MSRKLIQEANLQDIAAAIRAKNGGSNTYKPREMADAIRALPSTSTLVSKTITQNGSYSPQSDNADGYSSVTVNVPNSYSAQDEGKVVSGGALIPQTSLSITQNGTFNTTRNNQVTVNVSNDPTLVSKIITANGTYDPADDNVDGYSSVSVTVPGGFDVADEGKVVQNGALMPQTGLLVNANGTYDTTDKNSVVVNVESSSGTETTFAFANCGFLEGRTISATDGIITLTGDSSGSFVFAIPHSGNWTFSDGEVSITASFTVYGESKKLYIGYFNVVQNNTGTTNAIFEYLNGGKTLRVSWPAVNSNSGWGFTFTTLGNRNVRVTKTGTGSTQYGTCTMNATLPKIISEGNGRGSYESISGQTVSYNANYPKFFAGVYSATAGATVTYSIEVLA